MNVDDPNYTYRLSKFKIIPKVCEALYELKQSGYVLAVVTNQSGIAQGIYTAEQMKICHIYMQNECEHVIDHFYFSPYHPSVSHSLARKPGTLMFEKAIARFNVDIKKSWMVGDRGRDIIPARQLGIKTIQIGDEIEKEKRADFEVKNLWEASRIILKGKV